MPDNTGYEKGEKGSIVSAVTNALLFLFKISAGIIGHSNAMIADAIDTFGDVITGTGMVVGFKIAKQPADDHHPYGHGRAESIIAKLLAIFLIILGIKIAYDSVHKMIFHKTYIPGMIALVAAVISIVTKFGLYQYLQVLGKKISSTSITIYSWNIASDVFSSFAALIGIGSAMLDSRLRFMDPLAALVISIFVIRAGFEAFHRAYDELMDAAPSESVINEIKRITLVDKNVKAIKDIKVRKMGLDLMIDMTIDLDKDISVEKGHAITDHITKNILRKTPTAKEVFIHVEPFVK